MKLQFLKEADYWVLVAGFMILWTILVMSVFGIWENKKIAEWKRQQHIISDLKIDFKSVFNNDQ